MSSLQHIQELLTRKTLSPAVLKQLTDLLERQPERVMDPHKVGTRAVMSTIPTVSRRLSAIYGQFIAKHPQLLYPGCFDWCSSVKNHAELGQLVGLNTLFDQVYVLNIKRRADRWQRISQLLKQNGFLHFKRFEGFDGNTEPYLSQWSAYSQQLNKRAKPTAQAPRPIRHQGSWAILKSMKELIKEAKAKGYRRILTLQDDLLFHKDFRAKMQHLHQLPNWKLLYLGASQHLWDKVEHVEHVEHVDHIGYYYPHGTAEGAFAVAIDSSVYDLLLEQIELMTSPFDSGPLCHVQRQYPTQCLVLYPNLVIADIRDSDLRKKRSFSGTGQTFKWDITQYRILPELT